MTDRGFEPSIEDNFVYAGTTTVPIEGYGTIMITVQGPNCPKEIYLNDTAYIPAFHTTVASLRKFA